MLLDVFMCRLRSFPHNESLDDQHLTDKAMSALERVRLMRVFDFPGLMEAVVEVSRVCLMQQGLATQTESLALRREAANSEDEYDSVGDTALEYENTATNLPSKRLSTLVIDNVANVASAELSRSHINGELLLFQPLIFGSLKRCQVTYVLAGASSLSFDEAVQTVLEEQV